MSDGIFVAYGEQGLRMASRDGRMWSEPVLEKEKYYFKSCVHGNGQFLAFATFGGKVAFFASPDGLNWEKAHEQEARDGGRLLDIAYGNGLFLVIGGDMDGHWTSVMTSKDGRSWDGPRRLDKEPLLMRVTFGNGVFVSPGVRGRVAISEDGQKWTDAEPLRELDTFIDIAFGNGVFVGAGLHGLRMFSTDGLRWKGRDVGQEGEHINNMLWTGEQFVGVGLGASYFSPDGKTWTRKPNQNAPVACCYGDGLFIGAQWRGRLLLSEDAIEFSEVLKSAEHVNGVCWAVSAKSK